MGQFGEGSNYGHGSYATTLKEPPNSDALVHRDVGNGWDMLGLKSLPVLKLPVNFNHFHLTSHVGSPIRLDKGTISVE